VHTKLIIVLFFTLNILLSLDNPGFEKESSGQPESWTYWINTPGEKTLTLTEDCKEGSFAVQLTHENTGLYSSIRQTVPLVPYTDYKITFWAKVAHIIKSEKGAGPRLFLAKADGSTLKSLEILNNNWEKLILNFNSDSLDSMFLTLYLHQSSGSVWFDGLEIVQGNTDNNAAAKTAEIKKNAYTPVPPPELPEGENIALNKKYTLSVLPVATWNKLITDGGKALPDPAKILTDGEFSTSTSFWTSEKAISFAGSTYIDVVVDLGKIYPIAGIGSGNSARPAAGIFLPVREEYYVSDNGNDFFLAAVYSNLLDPPDAGDVTDMQKRGYTGIVRFSSGPIESKGRYVLVRTYGTEIGTFKGYVAHDELVVIEGGFSPLSVKINSKTSIKLGRPDISTNISIYRVNPPDYVKESVNNPLYIGIGPTGFLGDKEYHLSVDGLYVIQFVPYLASSFSPVNTVLTVTFPESVEILAHNTYNKTDIRGSECITELKDDWFSQYMRHPFFFIRAKKNLPIQDIGALSFSYTYTISGKKYSSQSGEYRIILRHRIEGQSPLDFPAMVWMPYQARHTSDMTVYKHLLAFYRTLGINGINGGQNTADIYSFAAAQNMTVYSEAGVANGMMLGSIIEIPETEAFVYHPERKRSDDKRKSVCPQALLEDANYKTAVKKAFINKLSTADHIYANWEPYMFQKQGCVCERCKKKFIAFGGKPGEWPDAVIDNNSEIHNRFSSRQYADIVIMMQQLAAEAGKESGKKHQVNFVPAFEPSYTTPGHDWNKVHNPELYFKKINYALMWFYPNTVNLIDFSSRQIVGNNINLLVTHFGDVQKIISAINTRKEDSRMPRIGFMATEYWGHELVMPKDYYFTSLLVFFSGMHGYGTWCTYFKGDARYLSLQAEANTLIARFEKIIINAEKNGQVSAVSLSPVPAFAAAAKKPLHVCYGYLYQGKYYAAIGNDYPAPQYVSVKFTGLPAGSYRLIDIRSGTAYEKSASSGFSHSDISKGVTIRVSGKDWAFLEISSAVIPQGYTVKSATEVKNDLLKEKASLEKIADIF